MPSKLSQQSYGKSAIRLTKVKRGSEQHELIELEISIELTGDFDASYLSGDNSQIIPTDTMKNTVYALAASHPMGAIEEFGLSVARHFLTQFAHVQSATINLAQTDWQRLICDEIEHPHAFIGGQTQRRTAIVHMDRCGSQITAGIKGMTLLKTADSAFAGFIRDAYTTLPDTQDRIFATRLTANWRYDGPLHDYNSHHGAIVAAMLRTFGDHKSLSVQQTLYAMGEAAMQASLRIAEIDLEMPNEHRLPVNLEPFGLPNNNEIFIPTSEPFGLIKATLKRD